MKHSISSSIFIVLGVTLLAGCRDQKGPVVAKVGSIPITLREVQTRLREMPPAYQQYVGTSEGRRQYLQLVLREKTVLARARQEGLNRDASYQKAIEKYKDRQASQLEDYKDSLLVETYLRKLRTKDLAATDADVQAFFDQHQALYAHPQEAMVSHILVNSREDADQVIARLKAGEAFDKIAHDVSRDPSSAAQGGRLAPFRHGTLVPEFEDAAFSLKKEQVSGIVQTQFGFHIIKKLGQVDLPPRSYADAKEEIRRQLERMKFDQWVTKQETELGVKIDEPTAALLSVVAVAQPEARADESAQEMPKP
jgi:peptidyl-prolyl cis-trans isomerase C